MVRLDLFDLYCKISVNAEEFERGLESASKKIKKFSSNAKNVFSVLEKGWDVSFDTGKKALDGFTTSVKALAGLSTVMAGFGATAVKAGAEFDSTMSEVSAISGATGKDFDMLRDKALEMGAKTQFSASEAAQAMTYMGMAGWKAGDMVSGISGIMNLAAASGEDLATTSDIVTDALTAFGMKASDSGRFADVLAAASSNANTNVGMLGESFKYVAPVAGALGYSAEDTALALGLMANSGIKASQAGTSLRTAITNMASPTKNMAAVMSKYDLSLTDANGNMKSLGAVMDELRLKMRGVDEATQAADASLLFGKEAMSGMLAVINAAPEDYEKLTSAIYECNGAAKQMAATMMDNLAGDVKLFKSAMESLQIAVSDTLTPTLREFTQFGTRAMGALLEGFQGGSFSGMAEVLSGVVTEAVGFLSGKTPEFMEVSLGFIKAMAVGLIDSAPQIIDAARTITTMLSEGISDMLESHSGALAEIGTNVIMMLSKGFGAVDAVLPFVGDFISTIAYGVSTYFSDLFTTGLNIITAIIDGISSNIDDVADIFRDFVVTIVASIRDNAPKLNDGALTIVKTLVDEIGYLLPWIMEVGADIISTLGSSFSKNLPEILAHAATLMGNLVRGLRDALPKLAEAAVSIIKSLAGYLRDNLPTLIASGLELLAGFTSALRENSGVIIDAAIDLMLALVQGLSDGLPALIEYVPEIISNIANILNDNAPKIIGAAIQIVATLAKGMVEAIPVLIANIPKIISAIVDVITAFNWINLGASIVNGLINGIKSLMGDVGLTAQMIVQNITTVLGDLPGFLSAIGSDLVRGLIKGIEAGFTWITESAATLVELIVGTVKNLLGIHSPSTVFAEIGGNIVDGIKNGISNAWNSFIRWLGGKVNGIVDAVKGMLGIHSPSKVFAGIGENMALGLAEGWDDEYSAIKRQIENGLNFGTASVGLTASGPSYGMDPSHASGLGNISGGNTYNFTFNSPKALDPIAASREARKASQLMALGMV